MARIRTIKPEIWGDEKFGMLATVDQLVYIGLISNADDAGRLVDSVRLIDGLIWPYDESRSARESIANLSRATLIKRGVTASGQKVIQIVGWKDHQKVDRPNFKAALPPISVFHNDLGDFDESLANQSRQDRESIATHIYDLRPTTNDLRPASDARDPVFGSLDDLVVRSIKGLYGWEDQEGTDEVVWPKDSTPKARQRCVAIAVQRLEGEGKQYQGRLFRSILSAVIAEQSTNGVDPHAETWAE